MGRCFLLVVFLLLEIGATSEIRCLLIYLVSLGESFAYSKVDCKSVAVRLNMVLVGINPIIGTLEVKLLNLPMKVYHLQGMGK